MPAGSFEWSDEGLSCGGSLTSRAWCDLACRAMNTILLLHGVMSSAANLRRNQRDLEDLGWSVVALDLPGHGGRRPSAGSADSVDGMALDVAARLDDRSAHLVVGHSLGAIVGLRLARLRPDLVSVVVLEDPPGLASADLGQVAAETRAAAHRARLDPDGETVALLRSGRNWSWEAAEDAVRSRQVFDDAAFERFSTTQYWNLPALIAECPAPVHLIAATEPDTMLTGVDRERVMGLVPPDRVRVVESAHSIHRDRPALWLISVVSAGCEGGVDQPLRGEPARVAAAARDLKRRSAEGRSPQTSSATSQSESRRR
jgi:pimeloyl-ACP methyl ester carboxylesterase